MLLLDDLPVDSYIERGVLADMTDFVQQLISDGTILENIVEGTASDGKTTSCRQPFLFRYFTVFRKP